VVFVVFVVTSPCRLVLWWSLLVVLAALVVANSANTSHLLVVPENIRWRLELSPNTIERLSCGIVKVRFLSFHWLTSKQSSRWIKGAGYGSRLRRVQASALLFTDSRSFWSCIYVYLSWRVQRGRCSLPVVDIKHPIILVLPCTLITTIIHFYENAALKKKVDQRSPLSSIFNCPPPPPPHCKKKHKRIEHVITSENTSTLLFFRGYRTLGRRRFNTWALPLLKSKDFWRINIYIALHPLLFVPFFSCSSSSSYIHTKMWCNTWRGEEVTNDDDEDSKHDEGNTMETLRARPLTLNARPVRLLHTCGGGGGGGRTTGIPRVTSSLIRPLEDEFSSRSGCFQVSLHSHWATTTDHRTHRGVWILSVWTHRASRRRGADSNSDSRAMRRFRLTFEVQILHDANPQLRFSRTSLDA